MDVPHAVATSPRPRRTFGTTGCRNCVLLERCGGHPLPFIFELGCTNYANGDTPFDTDDMNPLFPERFWELWDDVGGLLDYSVGPLRGMKAADLPRYVAKFQNKYLRRSRLLDAPIIALRLFDVLKWRKDGTYGPKYTTASALRTAYGLRQDTKVILIGVDTDPPLEIFWAELWSSRVAEQLADLGVIGVTVPNFSFFTCVPRFQIMRNRKRLILAAEELSRGVPVAPHINAITPHDWEMAFEFLRDHPEISVITVEFETGALTRHEFGRETVANLIALQARLGRRLHLIAVGGARYYHDFAKAFNSFTVIDSQPFMQARSRCILQQSPNGRWKWVSMKTEKRMPLDELIETNILHYEERMGQEGQAETPVKPEDPRQMSIVFETSTPYLVAQA